MGRSNYLITAVQETWKVIVRFSQRANRFVNTCFVFFLYLGVLKDDLGWLSLLVINSQYIFYSSILKCICKLDVNTGKTIK